MQIGLTKTMSLFHEMLNASLCYKTAKFKECKRKLIIYLLTASLSLHIFFFSCERKVQFSLRQMKDDLWNRKAEAVLDLAESGNSRAFFKSLKEIYGPRHSVTSPLFNKPGTVFLTKKVDVMDRWKEHLQDLLNRPSSTDSNAFE